MTYLVSSTLPNPESTFGVGSLVVLVEVAMEEEWMVEEEVVVEAEATMEATETEGLCLLVCYYWT